MSLDEFAQRCYAMARDAAAESGALEAFSGTILAEAAFVAATAAAASAAAPKLSVGAASKSNEAQDGGTLHPSMEDALLAVSPSRRFAPPKRSPAKGESPLSARGLNGQAEGERSGSSSSSSSCRPPFWQDTLSSHPAPYATWLAVEASARREGRCQAAVAEWHRAALYSAFLCWCRAVWRAGAVRKAVGRHGTGVQTVCLEAWSLWHRWTKRLQLASLRVSHLAIDNQRASALRRWSLLYACAGSLAERCRLRKFLGACFRGWAAHSCGCLKARAYALQLSSAWDAGRQQWVLRHWWATARGRTTRKATLRPFQAWRARVLSMRHAALRVAGLETYAVAMLVRTAFTIWRACVSHLVKQRARAEQRGLHSEVQACVEVFRFWQLLVLRGQRETLSRLRVGTLRQRSHLRAWRFAERSASACRALRQRGRCRAFRAWAHRVVQLSMNRRQAGAAAQGWLHSSVDLVLRCWGRFARRRAAARRAAMELRAMRAAPAFREWATLAKFGTAQKACSSRVAATTFDAWKGRVVTRKELSARSLIVMSQGNQRISLAVLLAWWEKVMQYKARCLQVQAAHVRIISLCRQSALSQWHSVAARRGGHRNLSNAALETLIRVRKKHAILSMRFRCLWRARLMEGLAELQKLLFLRVLRWGFQAWAQDLREAQRERELLQRAAYSWAGRWGAFALRAWSRQSRWQHTTRLRIEAFQVRLRTLQLRQGMQGLLAWQCGKAFRLSERSRLVHLEQIWINGAAERTARRVTKAWQQLALSSKLRLEVFEFSQWRREAHHAFQAWVSYASFRERKRTVELHQAIILARKVALRRWQRQAAWRQRVAIVEDALARRRLHESVANWWAFAGHSQRWRAHLGGQQAKWARAAARNALRHCFEQAQLRKRMRMLVSAADHCARCFAFQVAAATLRAWQWHLQLRTQERAVVREAEQRSALRRAHGAVASWSMQAVQRRRVRWLSRAALLQWMENILAQTVRTWRMLGKLQSRLRGLQQRVLQREAYAWLSLCFKSILCHAARRLRDRARQQQAELHVEVLSVKSAISFWHVWARYHGHRRKQAISGDDLVDDIMLSDFITPCQADVATIFSAESGRNTDESESIRLGGSTLNEAFERVAIEECTSPTGIVDIPQRFFLTPEASPDAPKAEPKLAGSKQEQPRGEFAERDASAPEPCDLHCNEVIFEEPVDELSCAKGEMATVVEDVAHIVGVLAVDSGDDGGCG